MVTTAKNAIRKAVRGIVNVLEHDGRFDPLVEASLAVPLGETSEELQPTVRKLLCNPVWLGTRLGLRSPKVLMLLARRYWQAADYPATDYHNEEVLQRLAWWWLILRSAVHAYLLRTECAKRKGLLPADLVNTVSGALMSGLRLNLAEDLSPGQRGRMWPDSDPGPSLPTTGIQAWLESRAQPSG